MKAEIAKVDMMLCKIFTAHHPCATIIVNIENLYQVHVMKLSSHPISTSHV